MTADSNERGRDVHRSSADPLASLDELFGGIASAVGAEAPPSFVSELSESDKAALNNAMMLVGALGVTYTLNTRGDLLVPIGDGFQMIVISPILLAGDEWLSMQVVIRWNVLDEPGPQEQIAAFCRETSLYYGAKCMPLKYSVRLMNALPADGLDARTLLRAMRRLAWILADASEEISRLPGQAPSSIFVDRFPVKRSIVAGPEGIADCPSG